MTVPKLRFSEFWDVGEWEEKKLSAIAELTSSKRVHLSDYVPNGIPFFRGKEISLLKNNQIPEDILYISEEHYEEIRETYGVPEIGDILITAVGTLGNVYCIKESNKFYFKDGNLIWMKNISEYSTFLEILLNVRNKYVLSSAIGSSQKALTMTELNKLRFAFPKIEEQKKIADCLSSISDRITAETQKLDTLKAHKKGLMQQLFPAESETLPKLRFPEFQDAGEWEEDDLSKLSSCGLSNGVFNDPKKVGRGYKLINVLDMYIDTAINEDNLSLVELSREEFLKNKVENGDLFFTRSSLVKSGIAYSNIYLGNSSDITFDGHLIRFRPNKEILIPTFINYLLRTNKVRSQLVARGKTATMTTIGQADVGNVKLSFPHIDEQQKIVDCLSSIDDRITAQIQKIDTLKTHKKGLMQQLFPSVEEVKA